MRAPLKSSWGVTEGSRDGWMSRKEEEKRESWGNLKNAETMREGVGTSQVIAAEINTERY